MIETKDSKRSLLIPKWPSYFKINNEENIFPRKEPFDFGIKAISGVESDLQDFRENQTITKACSLLHSAFILNDESLAKEAASFIIEQPNVAGTVRKLAEIALGTRDFDGRSLVPDNIKQIRNCLRNQTRNSLLWLELARLHTIKGRPDKAERCILIATDLASQNRYVIRSAVRFFIHMNQPDRAYAIVRRAAENTDDPWIIATHINSAILADKKTPKLYGFKPNNIPRDLLLHYSELVESLAVVELRFGSDKRAKRLFRTAWIDPSASVVAHAEWIMRNRFPHLKDETQIDFSRSAEASCWHNYFILDLQRALEFATEWILEEPYSTHPFSCGSSIACSARDFALGIKFAREGLHANPGDKLLINNLIYALLKQGAIKEAEKLLLKYRTLPNGMERIYFTATTGLYFFKIARPELGRKYYEDAYILSKEEGMHRVAAKALLCLAEAEKEINSEFASNAIKKALSESKNINEPSVILIRKFLTDSI